MTLSLFQPKLFLKYFLSFLNTMFIRKTIHQDEESTNLRRILERLVFTQRHIRGFRATGENKEQNSFGARVVLDS